MKMIGIVRQLWEEVGWHAFSWSCFVARYPLNTKNDTQGGL